MAVGLERITALWRFVVGRREGFRRRKEGVGSKYQPISRGRSRVNLLPSRVKVLCWALVRV